MKNPKFWEFSDNFDGGCISKIFFEKLVDSHVIILQYTDIMVWQMFKMIRHNKQSANIFPAETPILLNGPVW